MYKYGHLFTVLASSPVRGANLNLIKNYMPSMLEDEESKQLYYPTKLNAKTRELLGKKVKSLYDLAYMSGIKYKQLKSFWWGEKVIGKDYLEAICDAAGVHFSQVVKLAREGDVL